MSEENKNLPKADKEEEKGNKKREVIKNVAIIFLAVMLVLTFFSNTIMNYSLPQVSTQMIGSGTIKSQVRGKGLIEIVDPYNVTVDETRTISSVRVKEGDEVKAGDVIYSLEGIESEELASLKESYRKAETSYLTGILSGTITLTNNNESVASIQGTLNSLQSVIDSRQADIDLHKNNSNMIQLQIDALGEYSTPSTAGYDNDIAANQANIDRWTEELTKYESDSQEYEDLSKKISDAKLKIIDITYNKTVASNATDPNKAKREELATQKKIEDQGVVLSEKAKADAQANYDKYVKEMTGQVTGSAAVEELNELREKIESLEKKSLGAEIVSPVDGRIVSLAKAAGEKTEANSTVATIQVEGKGFTTKISVDAKQAAKVKVGDTVTIDDYMYWGVTANLVAIQPDKDDPKNKKTLVFDLVGDDLAAGGSISLAVGDANANYNLTVPKSALRQDNKGNFILILEPKSVPFGTRYVARRMEVTQIYDQDDFNAAIEANVDGWGTYVITNSTKPVKSGNQVRLATSEEE